MYEEVDPPSGVRGSAVGATASFVCSSEFLLASHIGLSEVAWYEMDVA